MGRRRGVGHPFLRPKRGVGQKLFSLEGPLPEACCNLYAPKTVKNRVAVLVLARRALAGFASRE